MTFLRQTKHLAMAFLGCNGGEQVYAEDAQGIEWKNGGIGVLGEGGVRVLEEVFCGKNDGKGGIGEFQKNGLGEVGGHAKGEGGMGVENGEVKGHTKGGGGMGVENGEVKGHTKGGGGMGVENGLELTLEDRRLGVWGMENMVDLIKGPIDACECE
eukprot:TRINITY_DN3375_c0_g1_i1.p2 TRINITY_DN3375_c0_g1~~TRINITY_DN3375_c0_g1_i1.p2  ORF type:complete len:156 (-),score=51.08 TRINITY_DN3375_c0_g1_i1:447-914(-)